MSNVSSIVDQLEQTLSTLNNHDKHLHKINRVSVQEITDVIAESSHCDIKR